jgi:hypothetical protein
MRAQPWQPKWISIDWGYQHHSVVLWHTLVDIYSSDGTPITVALTYRELAVNHMGEKALAQTIVDYTGPQTPAQAKERDAEIEKIDKVYLDSACFGDGPNSRADQIGDVLRYNKLPRPELSDKDRVDGWRLMHEKLSARNDMGSREYSDWIISEECEKLLQSIPLLLRDPKRLEDVKKTDTLADDFGDCARYGIKTHLSPNKKPYENVRAEILANCANNTARYMADLQLQEQWKNKNKFIGRRARFRRH